MRALLLTLVLLFASCASFETTGEVFVVTAGRETVKLSNSSVYLHRLENVQPLIDRLKAGEDAFEVFKSSRDLLPIASAVTDSDGRFKIKVPSTGRYVVEVSESRNVGSTSEHYWWLVPVSSDKVTLNNSNLISLTP